MLPDRIIAVRNNKTVYRDGDLCMKVFCEGYPKAAVLSEALKQSLAEETPLCVPKIRAVTLTDGKWTIISDYIRGKTLDRLIEENPDKKDEYLGIFIDTQLMILGTPCPLLPKLRDKMDRKISLTDFDATTRYELHTRLDSCPKHAKLCHGDFNPSNIIISEDGTPYILDWAHASQGNASADVAETYLQFWLAGDIDGAERYLKLFCIKSDTAKQYVQKWMPIVAAAQSLKGNEKQREFLHSWVNVVDFE